LNINGIELDPAANPGVLDTFTWDISAAADQARRLEGFLTECALAVGTAHCAGCLRGALVDTEAVPESVVLRDGAGYFLINLPDRQKLLAAVSPKGVSVPGEPIASFAGGKAALLPVDTKTVRWFVTDLAPRFSPRAFGTRPRLGIGGRQTVMVWPGIIKGLDLIGGPAETIQNSAYRELAPMEMILAPPAEEVAYLPGHGSVNIGHTGSSIEGFWLAGVVSHIENGCTEPYGADLDHVPVKAADEAGLAKARHLIDCGRHFSFFTLDASALFDFSTEDLSRRYDAAVEAAVSIYDYIRSVKSGEAFDFEFSLDEGPGITQPEELRYVLERLTNSGVTVNFVAPNVGFEKRLDYRLPDGLPALEARVREMSRIAEEYGALLDFHSGSDKSSQTYRTISRACAGKLKLKVSGRLQIILAEVLAEMDPDFFDEWWDYTLVSAKAEADAGSAVAADYVKLVENRRLAEGPSFRRRPDDRFFTDFCFGMVGAKNATGAFLHRHRFYSLSSDVQAEYTRRVSEYVVRLAEDLGLRRK
jgi:hypothetical protein